MSPQASGGASDTVTRAIQERLQAALGQPVVIDNRPGAGGNVGAAAVARSAPDGYTLMVGTDAMMTSNVHLYKSMAFDPVKDFAPITNAGANIIVMAVHADVPVEVGAELIAYAKANPGKLQIRLVRRRLAAPSRRRTAGAEDRHRHRARALSRRRRWRPTIWSAAISAWRSSAYRRRCRLIPTGKIRILAVVEKTRYAAMPDVPTVGETVPGFEMSSWLGLFAPAGTPAPIVARLNERDRQNPQGRCR